MNNYFEMREQVARCELHFGVSRLPAEVATSEFGILNHKTCEDSKFGIYLR